MNIKYVGLWPTKEGMPARGMPAGMQLLAGSSSFAFWSSFLTVSQYCGLYTGLFEPILRMSAAARSACSSFNGLVVPRGNVAIRAPLETSRVEDSVSTAMPALAIWFGTPIRLSPNPFQTPLRSGCPSGVRGVVPDGTNGALVVRDICENCRAITAAGSKHSAAATAIMLLNRKVRILRQLLFPPNCPSG